MNAISGNQNSPAQIEQYKTYFKQLNIAQYGAGILMQALNENNGASEDDMFGTGSDESLDAGAIPSAVVNINKESVEKKLWKDLEAEILAYEKEHPELKDKIVVALNTDTQDGQPVFTVVKADDILALLSDKNAAQS